MDSIHNTTLFPMEKAFKVVTRRADEMLRKTFGCGRREMWILMAIHEDGKSQRDVGDCLGLHPNVVVKLLDGMETSGLLRRVRRRSDRREQVVEATAKGAATLEKYMRERAGVLREVFRPLTDEQLATWRELSLLILHDVTGDISTESDG